MTHPILLYDGVCGLCNRLVQFVLRRDRKAIFRFASLQSALAATALARHSEDPRDLDTVHIVINYNEAGEFLLSRSDAVIYVLQQLVGIWAAAAFFMRILPRPVRDWAYRLVARHRYHVFGRYDTCILPSPQDRDRFLDV